MIFDAHADIWTDVTVERQKGMKDVFKTKHMEKFKKGNIGGGIFVIWIDPPYDTDPTKRTLEIIEHMSAEILDNKDIFHIIKEGSDIDIALSENKMPVLIGMEGLSGLGHNSNLIYALYMFGVRHAMLTWNETNELATGKDGDPSRGLTKDGIKTVKLMEQLGMIVDVSHANDKTFWEILENTTKPIIASHSNCRAICNVPRNLSDKQLKAIASRGGVVGLNAFADIVDIDPKKRDIQHLANHIDHMVKVIGIDHIGFGFDFDDYLDPATMLAFAEGEEANTIGFENASKAQNMIKILRERNYSEEDIEKISYKNFFRIMKEIL
ncbi:dipeptidase [Clostridium sp.]|uniref:dipeptidase n=1 Tax=Clostridium sp. TaxID=1506 RepID=UPI003D6CD107